MPANAQSFSMIDGECGTAITHLTKEEAIENKGETKYEKAFWMMFSAMVADPERHAQGIPVKAIADYAIKATDIGFKALEDKI